MRQGDRTTVSSKVGQSDWTGADNAQCQNISSKEEIFSLKLYQTFYLTNAPQKVLVCCHRSLAALGALACKMRIQAKDDVYEATRHRVAAAEEQSKKNWLVLLSRFVALIPVCNYSTTLCLCLQHASY